MYEKVTIISLAKPQVTCALFCQLYIGTDGKPVIFMVYKNHRITGYFYVYL